MKEFVFSNDFYKNLDAYVYTCGYEHCKPGHSYGPVLRSGYLIHYILEGCGCYQARGRRFDLKKGDAFLICPDELIFYQADRQKPWTYTWIGFQGVKIREYLERTSLLDTLVFHYGQDSQLQLCHEKMFEANQKPKNRDLILNSILYDYLFLLANKFPNERFSAQERQEIYVKEALIYLTSHYDSRLSVRSLAQHLGLDRSYLHRLFKAATRLSPQEYLLDLRIRKACELLQETELSISIISLSVGYEDTLYFSKLFRRKRGVSPSQYRIRHRKKTT